MLIIVKEEASSLWLSYTATTHSLQHELPLHTVNNIPVMLYGGLLKRQQAQHPRRDDNNTAIQTK